MRSTLWRAGGLALVLGIGALWSPARARAAEDGVNEIVAVLRQKGLIDEADQIKILSRNAAAEKAESPLNNWDISGDLRLRTDNFFFDKDSLGNEQTNRSRLRYRLRLGAKRALGNGLAVGFRLESGPGDLRGANESLGENPDFQPDPIMIDRAFIEWAPPATASGMKTRLAFGKTDNPFRWSAGPDLLIWDPDVNPEGLTLSTSLDLSERAKLFANSGAYVLRELKTDADPKVFGLQLGSTFKAGESMEFGLRGSAYEFRALGEGTFITSAQALGNLANAFDSRARIGELGAYLKLNGIESLPLMLWANLARNFTADAGFGGTGNIPAGDENTAIMLGLEAGDPKIVRLGAGFFQVEANAVIAQFTDSDTYDGFTNARGYLFYAARNLSPGVELRITLTDADSLSDTGGAQGPFSSSLADRNRQRLQGDLQFNF